MATTMRPITIHSRYFEGTCSACDATIELDSGPEGYGGEPIEVSGPELHEENCSKADLDALYAILERQGVQQTAVLFASAIARLASRLPSYKTLTDKQRSVLAVQLVRTAGKMVHSAELPR
jgi:hypothetical protein